MIDRLARAALALALLGSSVAAQEGAPEPSATWAFFDARCLLPLEEGAPPDTSGLVADEEVEGGEAYTDPATGLTLAVADESGLATCSVEVPPADAAALQTAFAAWGEGALTSGRYLPEGSSALRSRDWRTPPIRVLLLTPEAGDTSLLAVEEIADEA